MVQALELRAEAPGGAGASAREQGFLARGLSDKKGCHATESLITCQVRKDEQRLGGVQVGPRQKDGAGGSSTPDQVRCVQRGVQFVRIMTLLVVPGRWGSALIGQEEEKERREGTCRKGQVLTELGRLCP